MGISGGCYPWCYPLKKSRKINKYLLTFNQVVGGSIPPCLTKLKTLAKPYFMRLAGVFFFCLLKRSFDKNTPKIYIFIHFEVLPLVLPYVSVYQIGGVYNVFCINVGVYICGDGNVGMAH